MLRDLGFGKPEEHWLSKRSAQEKAKFTAVLDVDVEHPYKGLEELLAAEIRVVRLPKFLKDLLASGAEWLGEYLSVYPLSIFGR
jgi:hypothetical protein